MHQRIWHLIIVSKNYEGSKDFFGRCSRIIPSTYIHTNFGDVHKVLMVVLGKVYLP